MTVNNNLFTKAFTGVADTKRLAKPFYGKTIFQIVLRE